jgi:hypothetical protein
VRSFDDSLPAKKVIVKSSCLDRTPHGAVCRAPVDCDTAPSAFTTGAHDSVHKSVKNRPATRLTSALHHAVKGEMHPAAVGIVKSGDVFERACLRAPASATALRNPERSFH